MTHVTDDLELYALDALPETDRARVDAHLSECSTCRDRARELADVAMALHEALPARDVPARVRARILATAGADVALAPRRGLDIGRAWMRPRRAAFAIVAAAAVLLAVGDAALIAQRDALLAERDEYADIALRASHGGRNWYMAGVDRWAGSGGTLYAPVRPDASAFVVFHDLKPLDPGAVYALWLIDGDGRWWRAASFTPTGEAAQAVVIDQPVTGYAECAVTAETQRDGKRAGPVVMRSRIAPQTQ